MEIVKIECENDVCVVETWERVAPYIIDQEIVNDSKMSVGDNCSFKMEGEHLFNELQVVGIHCKQ